MKCVLIFIFLMFAGMCVSAQQPNKSYQVSSPNGKLSLIVGQGENGEFFYSFSAGRTTLIAPSPMGFELENKDIVPASGWTVGGVERRKVNATWKPVWGKRAVVPDCFREMTLNLKAPGKSLNHLQIVIRAYNDGVAFRYQIPAGNNDRWNVLSERTAFHFAGNYTAWFYNGEQHNIGPELLTESSGNRLPVMTVKASDKHYMAIHEADLETGAPMILRSEAGKQDFSVVSKPSTLHPGYKSAWRTILFGEQPGNLTDSHLLELLNPEPQGDFSWVKPGMAVWDWRINGAVWGDFTYSMSYPSWIKMVDFAAEQGFQYLVLDANWYGPEFETDSDPTKGDKAKDVQRLLAYAKQKGIGVWLYLNDVGGRKFPIEETLKQYGDWGAAGVKYGFMQGTPDQKNQWTKKITALCAQNRLLVDYHDGPVHPYGQMRTWPNAVTREYCHAQLDAHRVFVPKTFVTTVFVNMVAGPIDVNNGMFDLRQGKTTRIDENQPVPSTLVSEAARTLITFSGVTILPDIPEFYQKYPALLHFLSAQQMPWKESRTLAGEIGEYIIMMRQTKDAYLVAAATNEQARTLHLPLSFLGKGVFDVEVVEDGKDAHYLTNRECLQVKHQQVTARSQLRLELAPGGGSCLLFKPHKK